MSERKPNRDISCTDLCFEFSKAKPWDTSFFSSALKPATWASLSDESPKAAGCLTGVVAGEKII